MMTSAPASRPDVLVVASQRRWVADDFAEVAGDLPVLHDWGLDAPDLAGWDRPAWWTPAGHAARLLRGGLEMPLLAPGPAWLADVPVELTGRPVWAGAVSELGQAPRAGFMKPAEAKVETLPASWFDDIDAFATAAAAAGLPGDAFVQVSPARLDLLVEYRFFVLERTPVAGSPYLDASGRTWYDGGLDAALLSEATSFAEHVCRALGSRVPPACTLDVALTAAGQWLLLEANPAWCAAPYGAPLAQVLEVVLAAVDHEGQHPTWRWRPDPYLVARAARQRLLPARR